MKKNKEKTVNVTYNGGKTIFRTRLFLGMLCIVLAGIIAFLGLPILNQKLDTSTNAVVARTDIEAGVQITSDMVDVVNIPTSAFFNNYFSDRKIVIGEYATVNFAAGDYITSQKVSVERPFANSYLYDVPEGKLAISLTIPKFSSGLSNKLVSGDIVSVASIIQGDDGKDYAEINECLRYVKVLAVTNSIGDDVYNNTASDNPEEERDNATVTLQVSVEQALELVEIDARGTGHVIFVCRGTDERAEKYLEMQDNRFAVNEDEENPDGEEVTNEDVTGKDIPNLED